MHRLEFPKNQVQQPRWSVDFARIKTIYTVLDWK